MKPAAFDYIRASSLDDVCGHLADRSAGDIKLLAGGQSLVPLMAMRQERPARLIDINHVAELSGIAEQGGHVEIGAVTRQRTAERDPTVVRRVPLLTKALRHVGHPQIRNLGTVGGSIAHGDPSAEIPLVAVVLSASLELQSRGGPREVAAADFFIGPSATTIRKDECLSRIRFPVWPEEDNAGCAFVEITPRNGWGYAMVSAAAQIALDSEGNCSRAAIGVGACGPTPLRLTALEEMLLGNAPTPELIEQASREVAGLIEPETTIHASADYRRRVAPEIVRRALTEALAEAVN